MKLLQGPLEMGNNLPGSRTVPADDWSEQSGGNVDQACYFLMHFSFYASARPLDGPDGHYVFVLSVHLCVRSCVRPGGSSRLAVEF